jgi:hypothetical protein
MENVWFTQASRSPLCKQLLDKSPPHEMNHPRNEPPALLLPTHFNHLQQHQKTLNSAVMPTPDEKSLNDAVHDVQTRKFTSIRAAARFHLVSHATLLRRLRGRISYTQ